MDKLNRCVSEKYTHDGRKLRYSKNCHGGLDELRGDLTKVSTIDNTSTIINEDENDQDLKTASVSDLLSTPDLHNTIPKKQENKSILKNSYLRRHVSCGGNDLPLFNQQHSQQNQMKSRKDLSTTEQKYTSNNNSRFYHKNSTPLLLNTNLHANQNYYLNRSARKSSQSMEFPNSNSRLSISDEMSDVELQEKYAKAYAAAVLAASNKSNRGLITEVPVHMYHTKNLKKSNLLLSEHPPLSPKRLSGVYNSVMSVNSYNDSFGEDGMNHFIDHRSNSHFKSYQRIPLSDNQADQQHKTSALNISPGNLSVQCKTGRFLSRTASWRHNKHIQKLTTTLNIFHKDEKDLERGEMRRSLSIDNELNESENFDSTNDPVKNPLKDDGTQTMIRNIWTFTLPDGRRECKTQSDEDFFQEMIQDNLLDASEIALTAARYGFEDKFIYPTEDASMENKHSTSNYLKEQFLSFFQPSDNKLAMKLFGNKNALNKEKNRLRQQGKWIIHPCSSFRFYWDLIMLVLLIANLIILPVSISFIKHTYDYHWITFNVASDTIFLLDIIVNFRTGIITNDYVDEIILEPKKIAHNYLHSWFFLDLISSIPIDYFYMFFTNVFVSEDAAHNQVEINYASRSLRILRLVKLISLLRLLRLSRLVRYISQWEEFLNIASKFLGILNLVLLMLLLGHWNACLQFLIPMIKEHPVGSWTRKCRIEKVSWFEQYTWALFKAMSHMLSIGYGRFPPTAIDEAWINIVSMMTGATCYALFVGHAAALIQSFDCSKRMYREKFKQVEEYMAYRKLPRILRQRIANYYEHRYQGKMFNETTILEELSECLREQIVNYNCRALVAAVPFFIYADQEFVSDVVVKLRYEVFQPGDLIIKEGTIGSKMYFIQEGIVDIITTDNEVATSLSDGSYFGEICLLTNARRVASVRAETYCNLYSLDRASFLEVLDNYPLMRRTMESVAAERLDKIGKDPFLVSPRKDLRDDLQLVKEIVDEASPNASDTESVKSRNSTVSGKTGFRESARSSFAKRLRKKKRSRANDSSLTSESIPFSMASRRKSVALMVQKIGGLKSFYQSSSISGNLYEIQKTSSFPNRPKVIVTSMVENGEDAGEGSTSGNHFSRIIHKVTALGKKSSLIKKPSIAQDKINEDENSQETIEDADSTVEVDQSETKIE